jgi:hypothetical protein
VSVGVVVTALPKQAWYCHTPVNRIKRLQKSGAAIMRIVGASNYGARHNEPSYPFANFPGGVPFWLLFEGCPGWVYRSQLHPSISSPFEVLTGKRLFIREARGVKGYFSGR